jgi:hypothetical protein
MMMQQEQQQQQPSISSKSSEQEQYTQNIQKMTNTRVEKVLGVQTKEIESYEDRSAGKIQLSTTSSSSNKSSKEQQQYTQNILRFSKLTKTRVEEVLGIQTKEIESYEDRTDKLSKKTQQRKVSSNNNQRSYKYQVLSKMRADQRKIVHEEFLGMLRRNVEDRSKSRRERLERRWERGVHSDEVDFGEEEKKEADENLRRLEREMREELERRRRYKYKTYDFKETREVPTKSELKRDIETLKDQINPDRVELRDTSLKLESYKEAPTSKVGKNLLRCIETGKSVERKKMSTPSSTFMSKQPESDSSTTVPVATTTTTTTSTKSTDAKRADALYRRCLQLERERDEWKKMYVREASNRDEIASFQREKQNYEDEIRRLKTELRRTKSDNDSNNTLGISGSRLHIDTRVYLRTMARSRTQEKTIRDLEAKYEYLRRLYEEKTGILIDTNDIFASNTVGNVRDPLSIERTRVVPRGVLPDLT